MASNRIGRINEEIQRELSGLLRTVKDPRVADAMLTITHCASGAVTASELKGSNVLRYALADGTVILVRPSGTEPKIKVYILTLGKDPAQRDENIEKYSRWALALQK